MRAISNRGGWLLSHGGSALALAIATLYAGSAAAQTPPAAPDETPAEEAGAGESGDEADIVVTGSRIERAGFDQPTPTTVVGNTEIRQAAQPNLQQVLNDQPQMRNTVSSVGTVASTATGVAPVDLRGLGTERTLTLINGRRFIGDNNLNFVPTNLVERVEIVTGGASAAWGSGAVAGVVNIILNDKLEGLTLGANTGISSRGDGFRYGFDGSFGTSFADGRGHFMIGAEYVRDKGIGNEGMRDRPWFGADFVSTGNGNQIELRPNVNTNLLVDIDGPGPIGPEPLTYGGTIFDSTPFGLGNTFAGQVFNSDGTLRDQRPGDALNIYRTLQVASPLERIGSYARLSYDIGGATVWIDGAYGRTKADQPFLPDPANAVLAFPVFVNNAFLRPEIAQQLLNAGQFGFLLGRLSRDAFFSRFTATRETFEGAVGIDGTFGSGWKYSAHFSHGETDDKQRLHNSSIPENFLRAVDAVQTPGGIVCAVNANASTADDDPACAPFNPFGEGNASQAALNYVRGTQSLNTVSKLDSFAAEIQGDPFSLWAGPVTIAAGVEARWEKQTQTNGELDRQTTLDPFGNPASIFGTPLYFNPTSGSTNVKEAFAEALVPLLDAEQVKIELNGAARYSDYSRSGGIWSWKVGGTAHLFDTLLIRATRSRDIRAPSIGELFAQNSLNIRQVDDNDTVNCVPANGCDARPTIVLLTSGNPDLVPEVSKTWTVGGSFSPSFFQGFNLSVDYYDINISGAITTPDTSEITFLCAAGDAASCAQVDRDNTGTITTVRARQANIANFQTNGIDIEASYLLPMSRISDLPGALHFRALATYVDKLVFNTPLTSRDTAGSVGDTVQSAVPHWRGTFSATYQSDSYGLDLRLRYVGGGKFDKSDANIVNNDVSARTYVDIGAQFKVADKFTFFGNVRNVFDEKPPLTVQLGGLYDTIGRYFTAGVRLNF